LKNGNNPTGATVPRGFRRVEAPVNNSPVDNLLNSLKNFL
jgi:hypothetical protein